MASFAEVSLRCSSIRSSCSSFIHHSLPSSSSVVIHISPSHSSSFYSSFSPSSSSSSLSSSSPSFSLPSSSPCRRSFSSSPIPSPSSIAIRTSFELREALRLARVTTPPKDLDVTFKVAINLGVDPKKPNQNVRGVVTLPHGTGKKVRVAVFAKGGKAEEAKLAGADIVGEADLVDKILKGQIDFDRCIATPDMMGVVGRVARVLGPRGLMPNPKVGTITNDLGNAIKNAKAGQLQFKTEKAGIVHASLGKSSFTDDQIYDNLSALVEHLNKIRPAGTKGTFIRKVTISTTHSVGVPIDVTQPPFKAKTATVGGTDAA